MKVLFIVSSLSRSGPILVLRNIIQNIDIPPQDIYILKLLPDKPFRSITKEFVSDGMNVIECNFSKLRIELRPSHCARIVAENVKNIRPDVIHVHGYQAALVASKLHLPIPLTITLHNVPTEDFIFSKGKIMGKYMVWRFEHSLRQFSSAIAISQTVKKVHERLIKNKLPIDVIYNGVNLPVIDKNTVDSLKQQYKISQKDKIFVVIGHLSELKDPLCVIKAFKDTFQGKENVKLFFIGSGSLMEECRKEIDGDPRIFLVGYTSEVSAYLSLASYSISASHSEGFGLSVVESLAMGVPTIMTDIEVFDEFRDIYPILKPLKFRCGESRSLGEILLKVYETDDIMMESVRQDVNIRFSSREMGLRYRDHYNLLIGELIESNP